MNNIERDYDRVLIKIKIIGLFQIVGGIIGLVLVSWLLSLNDVINLSLSLLFVLIVCLYCFSIFCGFMLFRNPVLGLRFTLINQILQIFQIAMFGYAYKYVSGFGISIGIDLTDSLIFKFNFDFSNFQMNYHSDDESRYVKINILAILLSYYVIVLSERYTTIMKEREIVSIDDIGA